MRKNRVVWGLVVGLGIGLCPIKAVSQAEVQRNTAAKAAAEMHDPFGRTPLMLAAVQADTGLVCRLLSQGADINAKDKNEMTALMWAAPSVSLLLLQHGAEVKICDRFGRSPLHFAAATGDIPLIIALVKRGAPVEARDQKGWTPLLHAVNWGTLLFVTWKPSEEEKPMLVLNREQSRQRSLVEVIRTLLDSGVGVDTPDPTGLTPLMLALQPLRATSTQTLQLLLSRGANVNAKTIHGQTAMLLRGWMHDVGTVKMLLDHGADVNSEDASGFTALTFAAQNGDYDMAKLLVERGANVNGGKGRGLFGERRTPLMAAASHNPQIVKLLLQKGADVNARDIYGLTALGWSTHTGTTPAERAVARAIREMLKQAGAKE